MPPPARVARSLTAAEFDFVNITGPNNEINDYQKRLVHQVVRAKFPGLVTVSRNKFIQVIKRDDDQEAVVTKEKLERSNASIARGVRPRPRARLSVLTLADWPAPRR